MKALFTFFSVLIFSVLSAQQNPVTWSAVYKGTANSEGEIIITAKIEKGWHTYSQKATDAGPIPTTFTFPKSKDYEIAGKTEESNAHEEYVKAFEATLYVFHDKAEFRQKVKLKSKSALTIPFKVEFMSCNDMMCLPPKTIELSVKTQ